MNIKLNHFANTVQGFSKHLHWATAPYQMATLSKCSGFWMHSISFLLCVSASTKQKPRAKTAQPWPDQHRGGTSEPRRQWSQAGQSPSLMCCRVSCLHWRSMTQPLKMRSQLLLVKETDGGFARVVVLVLSSLSPLTFCILRPVLL